MEKKIEIFTGNCNIIDLYEQGLHPECQVNKVMNMLNLNQNLYVVHTNSPFVTEAFNKYGKEKGYEIIMYFDGVFTTPEIVFEKFSKPFNLLIFGETVNRK